MVEGSRPSSRDMPDALCRMYWARSAPATIVTAVGNNYSPDVVRTLIAIAEIVVLCPFVFDRCGVHLARWVEIRGWGVAGRGRVFWNRDWKVITKNSIAYHKANENENENENDCFNVQLCDKRKTKVCPVAVPLEIMRL